MKTSDSTCTINYITRMKFCIYCAVKYCSEDTAPMIIKDEEDHERRETIKDFDHKI